MTIDQQNPGRWCDECKTHGWHHTDRHDEFARAAEGLRWNAAMVARRRAELQKGQ